MPHYLNRRFFIKSAALLAGSLALPRLRANGDANSSIRVVVVGLKGRGKSLIDDVLRTEGAKLVGVCDVDSAILAKTVGDIEKNHSLKVEAFGEYRAVLDRKDIDAVVICTPNHWHALMTIWACQAGKDVYVEKPVCHNIWEGRRMVEAASKYGRIVQAGFQNRSDIGLKEALPQVIAGELGPIKMARGLCYRNRSGIGRQDTPLEAPSTVDYNTWLGPAADLPMYRTQFHYDWHWIWNTGNGDLGNQGPHETDLLRWALGDPGHPSEVVGFGGRFGWNDGGETPNMHCVSFSWGSVPVLFEVRDLWVKPDLNAAANLKGSRVGIIITCEGGEFRGGRGSGFFYDNAGKRMKAFKGDGGYDHFPAFIRAMRSRKNSDMASPLESGYLSSCLSHVGNISYQIGGSSSDEEVRAFAQKDETLLEMYERFHGHLGDWNIDFKQEQWTLGTKLKFDAKKERFVGPSSGKANALLKRKNGGRKGFQVPAKV